MQEEFDEEKQLLIKLHHSHLYNTTPTTDIYSEYIDPIAIRNAELDSIKLNEAENKAVEKEWSSLIRRHQLMGEAGKLLYNFKIIDHYIETKLDTQDMQIVSIHEQQIGDRPNYVVRMAVKSRKLVKQDSTFAVEEDDWMQETVIESTTAEPTTTVTTSATTPAAVVLPGLDLEGFGNIMKSCHNLNENSLNCVIPYMPMVLASSTIKPEIHKPCKSEDTCQGMSDCVPINGSQFACQCNPAYFEVEEKYTFKSHEQLLVLKNERCKSK